MKPNPDKELILRILADMPTATESQKREVIKMNCPYSVSSNSYKTWQNQVNNCLKATPSKKKAVATTTALEGHEQWIAEHLK